ncbi:MAG: uridine kinase [Gemmatimonadales bacterium]
MRNVATVQALISLIARLTADRGSCVLVAIDGRSGVGKSTLATGIADVLQASVVPVDDFFAAHIADAGWDARTPARRAADCLDWRRLRREALEPLKSGRPAAWHGLDFTGGPRADGSYGLQSGLTTRAATSMVLADGAYSARPELADMIDLTVLVEAPGDVRVERLAAREEPAFLAAWLARWDAAEDHYFTITRPRCTFDVVIGER